MPVTGLFYLPIQVGESSRTNDVLNRLTSYYNAIPLPPWTLSHRLFRVIPDDTNTEKSKPAGQRYHQILSLSHHAPRTYVAATATTAPAQTRVGTPASSNTSATDTVNGEVLSMMTIQSGQKTEDFVHLWVTKFTTLWQLRQTLHVHHGYTFEVGDFRVRVGELKQSGGGAAQMSKGTVVEMEWRGCEGDRREDWESAEAVIGAFWDGLGAKGARKVFWVPGLVERDGSMKQWLEILRLRT